MKQLWLCLISISVFLAGNVPFLQAQSGSVKNSGESVPVNADFNYYLNLCNLLINQQKYAEALSICDRTINLKKKDAVLWAMRSEILFNLERHEEAIASALAALQLRKNFSFALLQQCRSESALGNYEKAIATCEKALQINKDWGKLSPAVAWYNKALALELSKQFTPALTAYEQALKLQPNYSLALVSQCRVLSTTAEYNLAISTCNKALQINQNWENSSPAQVWYLLGLTLQRWGKYEIVRSSCPPPSNVSAEVATMQTNECIKKIRLYRLQSAIDAYEKAVALNPKDAKAWTQQAALLTELNRYTQSKIALEAALKVSPNYSFALATQCATLNKLGNYQAALAACDSALQGDGRWDENGLVYPLVQRSQALSGLGQHEEALATVERALSLESDLIQAWNTQSVIFWQMQKYPEALQANDRLLKIAPNFFSAWFNRGGILRAMKQNESAVQAYDRALASDITLVSANTLADVWVNRSTALWDLGKYEDAINSTTAAIGLNPNSVIAWFNRGVLLDTLKRYQEAAIAYEKAALLDPKQDQIWFALGVVLLRLNRNQDALIAFEEALKINPNNASARQNRDSLL